MTIRAKVAWCLGSAGAAIIVITCFVQVSLAGKNAAADRLLWMGAVLSLAALALAGIFLRGMMAPGAAAPAESSEADRELRAREQVMSSINANLEGTCVYRMIYHRDGRMECVYASPNTERLIGLPASEFVRDAARVFALIHPEDLPPFRQAIAKAVATGDPASIAVRVRHPNGGELWMQFRSHLSERRADGVQVRDGVVSDITSIKAAETELRAVRQRLELALRSSRTCIWENYVFANRVMLDETWAEIRGLPAAPTVTTGRALLGMAHPEDRAAVMAAMRSAHSGATDDYQVEQRIAKADGGWAWILSVGRVTARDQNGRAVRMFGTNTDITARRQAESRVRDLNANLERLVVERTAELVAATEKLTASERHYRNLVENINQGYYVSNRRSLFTYCNPAVAAVAGRTVGELLGTSVFRMVAEEDRPRVIAAYNRWARESVRETTIEFRAPTREGRIIWVEQSTTIVRAADGRIIEFRNTLRDVTERKLAEQALVVEQGRTAIFAQLGRELAEADSPKKAAVQILEAAQKILGWDGSWLHLWNETEQKFEDVADFDTIDGEIREVSPNVGALREPTPCVRRVMNEGPQLILRETESDYVFSGRMFGSNRRSLSLAFVPIRIGSRLIGVLSIQSYRRHAYDQAGLALLHTLASHCAGALVRLGDAAALRQSKERFFAVFDRSPIMIGLLTVPEGRLVEFNASGVATFGYTREEALGRTTLELGLWADPDERARYLAELVAKGHVTGFEAKMRRKNGDIFYVAYSGSIIEIGGQRYSLNSLLDITAQRESEARLSYALEATNDGLWDLNLKTGAVYLSPRWARLLGYAPGEVPARTEAFFNLLHPDDVATVVRAMDEHLAGRSAIKQTEIRLLAKSGEYLWFLDRGKVVVRDAAGAPLRMVGTITDIGERKRGEESSARTLASLRATLESTADGILTIGANRRIESLNSIFIKMWRVPPEIIASRDDDSALQYAMSQLVAPESFSEKVRYLYDHPLEESFDTLDFKDGRVFERFSRPMLIDGQPIGRVWSFRDVTARRRAEEEREQMQARLRATQKMEAMGTLAGGIAHDFNNILTGVINYSMLAREECPPGHPLFVKYLDAVLACGHRAKDLVRQILLFSRAEEGRQEPVQLQEVLEEALALLRSTLPATASIETEIGPRVPLILGSPTQLHQVVMNLGINAAQALPQQSGRIRVRLQAVDVDAALVRNLPELRPGLHARLEVSDTGCGMDATIIPRIFDPFFTTKPAGQGTGLGLSVVHGIVGGHHGAITVRSQPGDGAIFQIYFPAHVAKTAAVPPMMLTQQSRGHGERLLLVEDEPIVIETLKLILERLGYHVTEFSDPVEALARFEAGPGDFDALLTDYMMPGMTGVQLAEKIVTLRPSLPVLVTSGFFGNHAPEEIQRLNIRALIPKPIDMDELARALARALGR